MRVVNLRCILDSCRDAAKIDRKHRATLTKYGRAPGAGQSSLHSRAGSGRVLSALAGLVATSADIRTRFGGRSSSRNPGQLDAQRGTYLLWPACSVKSLDGPSGVVGQCKSRSLSWNITCSANCWNSEGLTPKRKLNALECS